MKSLAGKIIFFYVF